MARIAFIGLGTMGLPMASHLLDAGHRLVGCDVDPARAAQLGITAAGTPAEACADAELAILSLPSPQVVEEAAAGEHGAATTLPAGGTVIDMSTSPAGLARRLAAALEQRGLEFLDAPVSGGPIGAKDASLAIMVGGKREVFERWKPVLEVLGSRVEHVGASGAGQAVKLCNNLIVGATMAALSEACGLLEREGIEPGQAYEVFTRSTSDSAVMRRRFPVPGVRPEHPASNAYAPLFRLDLLRKDLGLALELAAEHGVRLPLTETAAAAYEEAVRLGLGELDYSAVHLTRASRGGQRV